MRPLAILNLSLAATAAFAFAQPLKNTDFSRGTGGWTGDAVVVFIGPDDTIVPAGTPGSAPALRFDLRPNRWTTLKQTLLPRANEKSISASFAVKALPTFQRAPESRAYSAVDFREGGGYGWSAEVWPKCDLLVRVKDGGWSYRPLSLQPVDTWKTFAIEFPNLTTRNRSFLLAFPPGTGSVLVKDLK